MTTPGDAIAGRLDTLDRHLGEIERVLDVLGLEMRAVRAQVTLGFSEVRTQMHELDDGLRELWTEHLAHSHPGEEA
ncbi:MAG TPA: hypothetical protein VG476_13980 [Acidimicrobiales bacterium]|nr:hypothetical protein [Acidimicrobiales bacterium]